ncbi:MAG TPA: AMP-binding protein [Ktedonobacteraceae bacterium]|nr:AMP-binding protein [Ktedonobacteraceae bacterium]
MPEPTSGSNEAPALVMDILTMQSVARADKIALICGESSLTFAELNARANRVANVLKSLDVNTGDRVAIIVHNSIEGIEVGAACTKIKAIQVPVNYRLREREVAYVLNDSEAKVVVAGPELVPVVEQARSEVRGQTTFIAIGDYAPEGWLRYEEVVQAASETMPVVGEASLGSSMSYTSGTTGNPKGAYRPKGVSLEAVLGVVQAFELRDSDVHLLAGPLYHSAPNAFVSLQILLGATTVILPKFDAVEALRLIDRHHISTTFMAPTLLRRLCEVPDEVAKTFDTSSFKTVILGGAPCPYSLKVRAIERFGPVVWEFYGATETGFVTILRPEDQLRKPGSCGTVATDQEIRLLNEAGEEVPDGMPGEMWVRNPSLAQYFKKPDATARSMRDSFFSVGDIAYRDSEGYYFICDRKIDMIISGGVNIYPAEIEAVLSAHPAVVDVAVIGVPDPHWGESVKAVVSLRPGASASQEELIAYCAERLADYKKPRSIDFMDELPRNPAGKLLKRNIREAYWKDQERKI